MVAFSRCPVCKDWAFSSFHKCKPLFLCGTYLDEVDTKVYADTS